MPLLGRRRPQPDDGLDLAEVLLQGKDMVEQTARAHRTRWGLGSAQSWGLDQTTGLLRWDFGDRVAEAPAQVLGSHSASSRSWTWGWAIDALAEPLRSAAEEVRASRLARDNPALTTARLDGVDEEQASDLAVIAFRITRATGFYQAPAGRSRLFMTFGDVVLTGPDGQEVVRTTVS